MKNFEERKAEIFRRSEQRLAWRKRHRRIGVLFVITVVCSVLALQAPESLSNSHSESAAGPFDGVISTDLLSMDKGSPLQVKRAQLTFDIPEFPTDFNKTSSFQAYDAKVTTAYTIQNPTEEAVTTTLLFPFGEKPIYLYLEDLQKDHVPLSMLAEKYGLMVNGEPVETTVCIAPRWPQEDLPQLPEEYVTDPFYSPDLPVTKYTYTISGLDPEHTEATVSFNWSASETDAKVLLENEYKSSMSEYDMRLFTKVANGQTVTVYVFGEGAKPAWTFYKDSTKNTVIDGTIALTDTETISFLEFAQGFSKPAINIAEVDWYNAVVTGLLECEDRYGVIGHIIMENVISRSSEYWQKYALTLQSGETVTLTVTAPLYPTVDYRYEPTVYVYTHRFYAPGTWMQPEELNVTINSPYYLTEGLKGYEKTDTGYTPSILEPPGEWLTFSLSTVEVPVIEKPSPPKSRFVFPFRLFWPVAAIAGGLLLIFIVEAIIYRMKKE